MQQQKQQQKQQHSKKQVFENIFDLLDSAIKRGLNVSNGALILFNIRKHIKQVEVSIRDKAMFKSTLNEKRDALSEAVEKMLKELFRMKGKLIGKNICNYSSHSTLSPEVLRS